MPADVFISYSRKDTAFALKLADDFRRYGINVWIDQGDIVAGDAWRRQIVEGIQGSRIFLVVLSPNSANSANVVKELSLAEGNRKRIIPLLYQPVDIPEDMEYQLAGLQYQAFDQGTYEDNLARLIQVITGQPAPKIAPRVSATRPTSGVGARYIGVALGVGCVIVLLAMAGAIGIVVWGMASTPTRTVAVLTSPIVATTTTTPTQTPPPTTVVPIVPPTAPVSPTQPPVTAPSPSATFTRPPTLPLSPTPKPAAPPSCGTPVESAFAGLWNDQSVYSRLGCPRNSAHTNQSAEEGFANGFMLWRGDNQQIYAITNDGTWQGFTNSFDENRDPEYSCGTHSSPPSPRRGFSKIWCGNSDVHNKLGNATEYETGYCVTGSGVCETFQDFSGGMMFYSQRSNHIYALMSDGTWKNR